MFTVPEILREVNILSIFVRLSLAVLFGGIIGIDRGRKRRPAGFRTYMLVCLGAALVMITNQYISDLYNLADPARLGAQVISGIGFLGAGTIIVTGHYQVIGLTTAAGLWASACMGLAVGVGFYEGAVIAGIFIFFILIIFHRLDNKMLSRSRVLDLFVEFEQTEHLSNLIDYVNNNNMKLSSLELVKPRISNGTSMAALITVRLPRKMGHLQAIQSMESLKGIRFVEEV